jgi:hypothetical protein
MLRQNKAATSFFQKVDTADVITFEIYVLVHLKNYRFEQGAYPCDEHRAFVLQEVKAVAQIPVEEFRKLDLELVRQLIHILMDFLKIIICLVVNGSFQICIEYQVHFVFLMDFVEDGQLLLVLGILEVIDAQDA